MLNTFIVNVMRLTHSLNAIIPLYIEVSILKYMTMICDLKKSRTLENRESVQYKLIDTLKRANTYFQPSLASNFIITLGDEWQGLLNYPCDYNSILDFFYENLDDIRFYCGIGVGEITIHNFELTVNQLDGPSFHLARKAINIAKQNDYSIVLIQ